MNKGLLWLGASISALALAACGTTPVTTAEAKLVDARAPFDAPFKDAARLVVIRDSGFICFAASVRIFVDGEEAASLGTGEKAEMYVSRGDHIVGATANALCAGGFTQSSITLQAGSERHMRTGFTQSGVVVIEPSAF